MLWNASMTSAGSRPIRGYWPSSARRIASVLISSMVRSRRSWANRFMEKNVEHINKNRRMANRVFIVITEEPFSSCWKIVTKRAGRNHVRPLTPQSVDIQLEDELQPQLDRPASSRSDYRVGCRHIRSGGFTAE